MSSANSSLSYEPIPRLGREDALKRIALGGGEAANAIYSIALHDEDDAFAEATCLNALDSQDKNLRFAAIGALGEMAYFSARRINYSLVKSRLVELREEYPELAGRIEDALDDIALAKSRDSQEGSEKK